MAHGGITAPMPFLSETRPRSYGRYAGETNPERFARFFHPDDEDGSLVAQRHGDHNRLGFALQLGTVRFLGTFLTEPTDVPEGVVAYAAARRAGGLPRELLLAPTDPQRARPGDTAGLRQHEPRRRTGAVQAHPLALREGVGLRRTPERTLRACARSNAAASENVQLHQEADRMRYL